MSCGTPAAVSSVSRTRQTTGVKHQPGAMSKDQSEPVSRGLLAGRLGNTEPDSDAAGREQDDVLGPQVHSLTPSNAGASRLIAGHCVDPRSPAHTLTVPASCHSPRQAG